MDKKNWYTHAEFVIMFITLVGGFYLLDGKIERQIQCQSARTDKLYEMFVQVQNEIKDLHGRTCVIETKIEAKK